MDGIDIKFAWVFREVKSESWVLIGVFLLVYNGRVIECWLDLHPNSDASVFDHLGAKMITLLRMR